MAEVATEKAANPGLAQSSEVKAQREFLADGFKRVVKFAH